MRWLSIGARPSGVALVLLCICAGAASITAFSAWEFITAHQVVSAFAAAPPCHGTTRSDCIRTVRARVTRLSTAYANPGVSSSGIDGYTVQLRASGALVMDATVQSTTARADRTVKSLFHPGAQAQADLWRSKVVALTSQAGKRIKTEAYPDEDPLLLGGVILPGIVMLGAGIAAIASSRGTSPNSQSRQSEEKRRPA